MAAEKKSNDNRTPDETALKSPDAKKKRYHKGRYRDSRRFVEARSKVDQNCKYPVEAGFELMKSLTPAKFDETVAVSVRLGIDPKKTDQLVRGAFSLPHGIGKSVRVIAFAEGQKAEEAKAAGAIEVGGQELAKKIEGGWMDFDVAIAAPDMMKFVGRLGRVLGPQGKMPSPKAGTVTPNVGQAVKEFAAGKVEFRTDSGANIHVPVGKLSFPIAHLAENTEAFVRHISSLKPSQAKGTFVVKVAVSSTMGPGIVLDIVEGGHA